jgi:hypothetical protein
MEARARKSRVTALAAASVSTSRTEKCENMASSGFRAASTLGNLVAMFEARRCASDGLIQKRGSLVSRAQCSAKRSTADQDPHTRGRRIRSSCLNAAGTHRPCAARGEKGGNIPAVALTSYDHLRLINEDDRWARFPGRGLGQ